MTKAFSSYCKTTQTEDCTQIRRTSRTDNEEGIDLRPFSRLGISLRRKETGRFSEQGTEVELSGTGALVTYLDQSDAQLRFTPVVTEQSREGTVHRVRGRMRTSLQILVSG